MEIRTRLRTSCFSVPDLAELRREIDSWRSTCLGPQGRMPERLWRQAVALARTQGAEHVAEALAVSLPALLRRLESCQHEPEAVAERAVFVDMTPPLVAAASPSELEILAADGTRLTLRFHGSVAALSEVVRSVLNRQP